MVGESEAGSLFERLGGRPTLARVHEVFYTLLFADPWLRQFFAGKDSGHLARQQTDFMAGPMGGPNTYVGKTPRFIHRHIFITTEVFEARAAILRRALEACEVPPALRDEWLALDQRLKCAVLKFSRDECSPGGPDRQILDVPKPPGSW